MTYKIYIKNDYKPAVQSGSKRRPSMRYRHWILLCLSPLALVILFGLASPGNESRHTPADTTVAVAPPTGQYLMAPASNRMRQAVPGLPVPALTPPQIWQTVTVNRGDNLSLIFARLGLSPVDLHHIITLNEQTARLKHLMPGQVLSFLLDEEQLQTLRYEPDLLTTLFVNRGDDDRKFSSELQTAELSVYLTQAAGTIDDSLFLAGQDAGLSDSVIMQLVAIFGWDIDFVLDIRKGDSFNLLYEEHYKDDIRVGDGPVLVAEFFNQKRRITAVRYKNSDGYHDYYSENGDNMRKAFLRTPLKFNRISSRFNLRRKHPVLNRIRAHRGVDYAAPAGTPVKATGDGTVHLAGRKGGYGKTVILRHGGKYSTLYAHLSRYARGIKRGKTVRQGDIIGYVGSTGLATGPHLHYEFQLGGVHRNPLTVKLPKAESIPAGEMARFRQATSELFALLETSQFRYAKKQVHKGSDVLALTDKDAGTTLQ